MPGLHRLSAAEQADVKLARPGCPFVPHAHHQPSHPKQKPKADQNIVIQQQQLDATWRRLSEQLQHGAKNSEKDDHAAPLARLAARQREQLGLHDGEQEPAQPAAQLGKDPVDQRQLKDQF